MPEFKPIPIGHENFKEIIDKNFYYVDKTLFIKEIIDKASKVNLFTRPRRFGKTLNMSMIQHYFEKTDTDNSYLFENLNIGKAGDKYKQYMGQYPVINLSLKSMKQPTFDGAFFEYQTLIIKEFEKYRCLLMNSNKITEDDKKQYENICKRTDIKNVYASALKLLSDCLYKVCQKNVIILIDEYDVPIENAHTRGFYDEMIDLIRSSFESALKTNNSLEFAILTGCLRVSKESIFTGLNNFKVNSIMTIDYSEYFGFTENEVKEMLDSYDLSCRFDDVKEWYDGYIFGKTDIYNPWSIINFVSDAVSDRETLMKPYWVNTSSNSIIHELIVKSDRKIRDDIDTLVTGGSIDKPLYNDITYVNMNIKSDCVWSFLLHTGYLKPVKLYQKGDYIYFSGVVPNREVRTIYESTFKEWFDESVRGADKSTFFNAVINGDAETFELEVNRWLLKSISYHDGYENFYHGFLAGLLEYSDEYLVESNRESGTGRSDIIVKDILTHKKAVIIEIKTAEDNKTLEKQCNTAIKQIEEKQYESNLETEGYKEIIKYGVAFNGKRCMIKIG